MAIDRVLEPEVMDTWEEATAYDAMDFTAVNWAFAQRAVLLGPVSGWILDAGTGTARIPILAAQQRSAWQISAIDLSENMLKVGAVNVAAAGLTDRILLEKLDAKRLPFADSTFDMVISNSIIHHLPDPLPFLREMQRVLKPEGAIFLRDLLRPQDEATLDRLVRQIGFGYDAHQTQLFRDSLYAAFTLSEIRDLARQAGLGDVSIYQSSDRHWSMERAWRQPYNFEMSFDIDFE